MSTPTYATPNFSNVNSSNNGPHFDLSSFLKLQSNYAMNLAGINVSGADGSDPAIKQLNATLSKVKNDVQDSQISANATLLNQNAINNMLNTENARLLAKKSNIDTAIQGQERMIKLNNNYQQRYSVYSRLLMIFVGLIVAIILLNFISSYLTIIPQSIFILIYIIIITTGLIYMITLYATLTTRNPMDYNEVMLPNPTNVGDKVLGATPTNASGVSEDYTKSMGKYYNCLGQECCAPGLIWSNDKGCYLPGGAPSPATLVK